MHRKKPNEYFVKDSLNTSKRQTFSVTALTYLILTCFLFPWKYGFPQKILSVGKDVKLTLYTKALGQNDKIYINHRLPNVRPT